MAPRNPFFDQILGLNLKTGNADGSNGSSSSSSGGTSGSGGTADPLADAQANNNGEFRPTNATTNATASTGGGTGETETNENRERNMAAEGKQKEVEQGKQLTPEEQRQAQVDKLLMLLANSGIEVPRDQAQALAASASAGLSGDAAKNAVTTAVANAGGVPASNLQSMEAVHDMKENLKGTFSIAAFTQMDGHAYNKLAANVSANQNAGKSGPDGPAFG